MNLWSAAALLGTGFGLGVQSLVAQSQDSIGAVARADVDTATQVSAPTIPVDRWLAQTLPASYRDPTCPSGMNQKKVKSAVNSLKEALESKTPEERASKLDEGKRTLWEAIQKDEQERNTGAWYTLSQIYLYHDDVIGADSALRHASELAPGCRTELDELRYAAWASLMNGGIEFSKAKHNDPALVLFRKAAAIDSSKPHAAMNAGVIFANTSQLDSAAVYFGMAAKIATAAEMAEERNRATFNQAAMLQQSSRHDEAARALEQYVAWVPDDNDAKQALATSYRAAGQTEKAQELEKGLLAAAGAGARDSGVAAQDVQGGAPVATDVAMRIGVNLYNDQKYADAAEAFRKVMEAEPNNRDAIYNLANTYLALKDGAKLVEVGTKLVRIESMSESALQLLGTGYRYLDELDKAIKIAEQFLALPVDVSIKKFVTRSDGAKLEMIAAGRAAQTPEGKPIPPVAVALAFEFLDGTGTVVATQDAAIPVLKADQKHEFVLEAKGRKIVAWRYTRK